MPPRYVLDASASVDILQRTTEGEALVPTLRSGDQASLWTVEHFHVEVAKVIRRDTLRGIVTDEQATQLVVTLAAWPLEVVPVAPLLEEAWTLRNNLTVHDALYVVLTRHLPEGTLVSPDGNLANAPGIGVPVITPDQLKR
ncbi:MAG: type II toxin-antitoxin system VapC family toxin [Actinomycetota bacterium]|nr:type II toxin-antitoxin system VapC family toxin [Actinomycetota bacterium]